MFNRLLYIKNQLIDKLTSYASSPYALIILILVAFTESSFFVVPPDVLLIIMAFLIPKRAFFYAAVTTVCSVLGGIFGYFIGYYFFDDFFAEYIINSSKYAGYFFDFQRFYDEHAGLAIFIAGFTPIPYKIATITSGFFKTDLLLFIFFSFLSRGLRFFILATLIHFYHKRGKEILLRNFRLIVVMGSLILIILIVAYKILESKGFIN